MLNKILLGMTLIGVCLGVWAQDVEVRPDHPDVYVVEKGDTLWDISAMFLTEPWRWPEIWRVNPQIANPHLIFPGDRIRLVYMDGEPVLTVDRDERTEAIERAERVDDRTVKLSPRIRYLEEDEAIDTIPIDAIREFLSRQLLLTEEQVSGLPYIVSSYDQHLVNASGNEIYVRGLPEGSAQRRYAIFRRGPAFRSPNKYGGAVLGYEATYVGDAYVHEFGDPATAVITESGQEIYDGDRLVEQSETEMNSDIIPREPAEVVRGNIIWASEVLSEIGQYQVVVVDLGAAEGMQVGHVLGVYHPGPVIEDRFVSTRGYPSLGPQSDPPPPPSRDPSFRPPDVSDYAAVRGDDEAIRLPEKYTGVVLVFRVFEEISYALVMEAEGAMQLYDVVTNP